jgi:hypothetical protein
MSYGCTDRHHETGSVIDWALLKQTDFEKLEASMGQSRDPTSLAPAIF